MNRQSFSWIVLTVAIASFPAVASEPIRNHAAWTDTAGNPISCHDGGITRVGDTFYWYGTSYKGNPAGVWGRKGAQLQQGFNCYSSKNLVDWKYEGVCLQFPKDGWLAQGTSHRPNVLACDKTGKYVLWFFCIGTTEPEYPAAMLAVAVADKPAGPFTFVGQRNTAEEHGWGQDLGLFKDQDGKGYLVYDDGHRNIRVDLLADDFLSTSGQTTIALKSDGKSKRYEGRRPDPLPGQVHRRRLGRGRLEPHGHQLRRGRRAPRPVPRDGPDERAADLEQPNLELRLRRRVGQGLRHVRPVVPRSEGRAGAD